jgi:transposase
MEVLSELCDQFNIRIIFLPFYSPELNPIEFVFGWIKQFIRRHRRPVPLEHDIMRAFACLPYMHVFNFYRECIQY